mgnify:CR=1 FL=1
MANGKLFLGACFDPSCVWIDVCAARAAGRGQRLRLTQARHVRLGLDDELKELLRNAAQSPRHVAGSLARLDIECGRALGSALLGLAKDEPIAAAGITGAIVGDGGEPLELGSPASASALSGVRVAGRFVEADLAAGGIGGPVRAWPNWLMLRDRRLSRVGIDIGAITELTFVPSAALPVDVVAMHTGPGLGVLDGLARRLHNVPSDADGRLAARGAICQPLLNELLANPYFLKTGPKLTTAAYWGDTYVERVLLIGNRHGCDRGDIMATAGELVARTIANAVGRLTERPHQVVLWGEGAMNIHLASRIRALLSPSSTITSEKFGVGMLAFRAYALCALAAARIQLVPIYCPHATGAASPIILGDLCEPLPHDDK